MNWDPIQILVIDDRGDENLGKREIETADGGFVKVPGVPRRLSGQFFDVRWLATPSEAREYMDRVRRLASRPASDSRRHLWIPEILIFDYALMDQRHDVRRFLSQRGDDGQAYREVSPLPQLREAMGSRHDSPAPSWENHPEPHRATIDHDSGVPSRGADDHDVVGAYVGGSLLLTIGDHPCSPVPFTVHNPKTIAKTDAAFFEWLLEDEVDGGFANKPGKESQWHDVLQLALPQLRRRIQSRVKDGRLQVALQDVLDLAGAKPNWVEEEETPSIRISSRLREATLPIRGLFAEFSDKRKLARAARDWAEGLLAILTPSGPHERRTDHRLADAAAIAERVWSAYADHGLMADRERLSELTVLLEEDQKDPQSAPRGGKDEGESTTRLPDDVREQLEEELKELRDYTFRVVDGRPTQGIESLHEYRDRSGLTLRWAALFIMVRLSVLMAEFQRKQDSTLGERISSVLSHEDYHLALYPSPSNATVLLAHASGQDVSNYPRQLDRLTEDGRKVGFALKRMISGEETLLPGERSMLRQYALGLGIDSAGNRDFFWERCDG